MNPSSERISSPLAQAFSRLVAYGLPVAYFLITVSFYLRTYDSAQIKITLTQIGCSFVIFCWLAQLVLERRWPFPKKHLPVLAPFLALLASGVVSFLQSSFQAGSVDEFTRRVLYVFMALIVMAEFRGWDRHRRLLRWLLAAFGVVVFYGFVQFFDTRLFPPGQGLGLDPFIWRQAFGHRVFSSFGNPNFYGNFLVLITPIVLAIYLRSGGQIFRPYLLIVPLAVLVYLMDRYFLGSFGGADAAARLWLGPALLGCLVFVLGLVWWKTPTAAASGMLLFWAALFINLYATETKGAWLGFVGALAAATVLVGFFFAGQEPRKAMGRLSWLVLLAVIFGVTVVGYYARRRIQSVNFRVFTWIATWEMIRAQPLLGAGIGTFKWAYPAHRRPEIIQIEAKSNTETDHAEDEYLEVWQDEGLLGFGIFLWLILTVSVLGVRALSTLTRQSAQGPPGERAYALLGYLGAYWGGLIHWFVDVSIRFVSSGIYSLLLPGAVAGLVLHGDMPARQDPPLAMDRRLRLGLAVFYTATLFSLRRFYEHHDVLVFAAPTLLIGLLLWLAGELIETRLAAGPGSFWRPIFYVTALELAALEGLKVVVLHFDALGEFLAPGGAESLVRALFVAQVLAAFLLWLSGRRRARSSAAPMAIEPAPASASRRPGALQLSAVVFLAGLWAWGFVVFRDVFMADVNHNVAIFFSKQGVWAKDPRFDAAVERFPPEMREEYRKIGGAIEHYEEVVRLNPHFPMARYFIGNVYNDWGSNFHAEALDARGRGEVARARELKERAEAMWEKSLAAYDAVKAFAPNYVQTHHQVGLVYLKMGEMERSWGHEAKGNEYWDKALENFRLYRQLDPVFPPNYYRTAHVHFVRGDYDKAEDAYLGALKYNLARFADRNAETYAHLGRLAYTRLVNRHPSAARLPGDADDFKAAVDYYEASVRQAELAGSSADRWKLEALKALAVLHTRAGHREKALTFWQKFGALRPDDPDVRSVFGGPPPPSRKP